MVTKVEPMIPPPKDQCQKASNPSNTHSILSPSISTFYFALDSSKPSPDQGTCPKRIVSNGRHHNFKISKLFWWPQELSLQYLSILCSGGPYEEREETIRVMICIPEPQANGACGSIVSSTSVRERIPQLRIEKHCTGRLATSCRLYYECYSLKCTN